MKFIETQDGSIINLSKEKCCTMIINRITGDNDKLYIDLDGELILLCDLEKFILDFTVDEKNNVAFALICTIQRIVQKLNKKRFMWILRWDFIESFLRKKVYQIIKRKLSQDLRQAQKILESFLTFLN